MNLNGVEYYYIRNGQGDIIGLFDNTAKQVVSYVYDTWGKLVSIKDQNGIDVTNNVNHVGYKNPYRYKGYRYDNETGLYYLNSRYYNPEWGRYLNADALVGGTGILLSHNVFAYTMNNPVNMTDPNGYWPQWLSNAVASVRSYVSAAYNKVVNVVAEVKSYVEKKVAEVKVAGRKIVSYAVSKKEPPPRSAGYIPPKGKGKVMPTKTPGGQKGFPDSKGNVWVPIPEGHPLAHGGEHWDVNYPNGGYDNVYPDGSVRKGGGGRGIFSPDGKRIEIAGGSAIAIYVAYRTIRMIPSLAPPLWWTIPENLILP